MRHPLPIAFLLLAACEPDPSQPDCDVSGSISGGVVSGPTDLLVDQNLQVRGITTHSEGRTIRRVLVAGIAATNDGFNFENWSATLPIDTLAGMARLGGSPVTIEVTAIDACDRSFPLDSFTVNVDPTPGIRVTTLSIDASISGGLDYLPASGSVPALLTISGNADAADAVVALTASVGGFSGAPGNRVTLKGDGMAPATATVLYAANTPTSQPALVTASAKGQLAQATIRVAGPPTLLPGSATLSPGQSLRVTVQTSGTIQECQASPAAGLAVTSGGQDLMATPGGADVTGDHLIDIDVAAAMVMTVATTTITCRDPYGQFSTGTYKGQP